MRRHAVASAILVVRTARWALFVTAGMLILVARDFVLQIVLSALGVYLLYAGAVALMRVGMRSPEHDNRGRRGAVWTGGAAITVVAGALGVLRLPGGTAP